MRSLNNNFNVSIVMFLLFLCSVLSFSSGTALASDEIVCITCHSALPEKFSQPAKHWKGSVHQENGIACNACHGGDPKDAANAMKKERGFLGAPKYSFPHQLSVDSEIPS